MIERKADVREEVHAITAASWRTRCRCRWCVRAVRLVRVCVSIRRPVQLACVHVRVSPQNGNKCNTHNNKNSQFVPHAYAEAYGGACIFIIPHVALIVRTSS